MAQNLSVTDCVDKDGLQWESIVKGPFSKVHHPLDYALQYRVNTRTKSMSAVLQCVGDYNDHVIQATLVRFYIPQHNSSDTFGARFSVCVHGTHIEPTAHARYPVISNMVSTDWCSPETFTRTAICSGRR